MSQTVTHTLIIAFTVPTDTTNPHLPRTICSSALLEKLLGLGRVSTSALAAMCYKTMLYRIRKKERDSRFRNDSLFLCQASLADALASHTRSLLASGACPLCVTASICARCTLYFGTVPQFRAGRHARLCNISSIAANDIF